MLHFHNQQCITAVVNVALEPDDPVEGIINLHVPMEDGLIPQVAFDRALRAIAEHIRSGRVLVHCVLGVSRSVTVVALHLATTEGLPLKEALSLVKELRVQADPASEVVSSAMRYMQGRKSHGRL
jgi:protein-tyrosine phosphatase